MSTNQLALKFRAQLKKKQEALELLNRAQMNPDASSWLKPAPPTPIFKSKKQKEKEANRLIPCVNCGRTGHTIVACLNPKNPYATA